MSAKRILSDLTLKDFDLPQGIELDGSGDKFIVTSQARFSVETSRLKVTKKGIESIYGCASSFYPKEIIKQCYYIIKEYEEQTGILDNEIEIYEGCELRLMLNDGSSVIIMSHIRSQALARFIEQETEKLLDIEDVPVKNESEYNKKRHMLKKRILGNPTHIGMAKSLSSNTIEFFEEEGKLHVEQTKEKAKPAIFYALILQSLFLTLVQHIDYNVNIKIFIDTFIALIGIISAASACYFLITFNLTELSMDETDIKIYMKNIFGLKQEHNIAKTKELDSISTHTDQNGLCSVIFKFKNGESCEAFFGISYNEADFIAEKTGNLLEK